MAFYKVRAGFWLHGLGNEPVEPGTVVELEDAVAQLYAHQIESVAEEQEAAPAPIRASKRKGGAGAR